MGEDICVSPTFFQRYRAKQYPHLFTVPSNEEEANFWDTHSITNFKAETETVKVSATRGLSANVQVRFDPETDHELEAIARERGMKKATLIRTWVLERLRQDRNRHGS